MLKTKVLNVVKCLICSAGLLLTFYTIIDLMLFLSDPNKTRLSGYPRKEIWTSISWSLLVDMSLLSIFILQHSLMAHTRVKEFFEKYKLQDIHRSFYVITTSMALQFLLNNWLYIPEITLWKLNLNYTPFWYIYASIHATSWILIYVGNICMDINELLGIKQVVYSIKNLPDPDRRKSYQLRKLCKNLRHPSFLAFILLFWATSVMSLDHFLLAAIFTSYMFLAWNTDDNDYNYQKEQYQLKFHELQYIES